MAYLINDLLGNAQMTPGCIDKFAFLVIIRGTWQPTLPSATGAVFAPMPSLSRITDSLRFLIEPPRTPNLNMNWKESTCKSE
jgi:hypothetical protein